MPNNKLTYEELLKENQKLKAQLNNLKNCDGIDLSSIEDIKFEDLFDIEEIQRIQNLFADVTGVASLITNTKGRAITKPSNFCRLCQDIIRNTEKGLKNCYYSDVVIAQKTKTDTKVKFKKCLSAGLWDASAMITVKGKHIANWMIGQIKNDDTDIEKVLSYAKVIGVDEEEYKKALDEVTFMPSEKFNKIAETLFLFADIISKKAYQNLQQKKLIQELKEKEIKLTEARNKAIESENRITTLINTLPDVVWLKDSNGFFLECNKRLCTYFGKSRDEIIGKSDYELIDQETADIYSKNDKSVIQANKPIIDTETVTFADGHTEILETIKTPLYNNENKIIGVLGIGRNITERIKAEHELLKSKEKAEESDRLKTAFLQNMSHEIRTPLNAISGFSELLASDEINEEKKKNFITIIKNSTNQLISIVNDILTISTLETKQEKTNISEVNINNIIFELQTIFKQSTLGHNISLFSKPGLTDTQSVIYTDKTKITQIISNLLSNAIKFTHKGSIEFGYKLKDDFLEFYVKDTGNGIEPSQIEKIFDRFMQADLSITKRYGGTGLGLAISKGFVELLGGKIWVKSELNQGSVFYFTIPYNPVNEDIENVKNQMKNNTQKTVLVAEDEEYNFLFIAEILSRFDLKLIHAKNGKEALEIFENEVIDLILMDIKMPIMDGQTATRIIKKLKPDIPIIAQSAYALDHEIERFSEDFDDYMAKPINSIKLKEKIKSYIEKI